MSTLFLVTVPGVRRRSLVHTLKRRCAGNEGPRNVASMCEPAIASALLAPSPETTSTLIEPGTPFGTENEGGSTRSCVPMILYSRVVRGAALTELAAQTIPQRREARNKSRMTQFNTLLPSERVLISCLLA